MTISILPSAIKSFFIIFNSIYIYGKASNISFSQKEYLYTALFSFLSTPIIWCTPATHSPYTIPIQTILVIAFCCILFKQKFILSLYISIISVGSSYALFALLALITLPLSYLLLLTQLSNTVSATLILLFIGCLQHLFLYVLFRTKRFRNGIPNVTNILLSDIGIFIGAFLILFSSALFIESLNLVSLLLISFVYILGIIIWLWGRKSIHTDYIFQSHTRRIDMLEDTLREKEAELDRLSKIIHKDNKLLAALEHSTRELLSAAPSDTAERLLQELNRFSEERRDTLSAYEAKQLPFPATSLFSIDTMLRYLQQRAQKYAIDFQVHFDENISSITDVITEQDLCTLIADLGENAIIATKSAEIKNILLSIEKKDSKKYTLNFFDSGEPFPEEVLAHLGKKRYTTHAATGGSGIGLMTTSELAQKYQAEFHISSTELSPPYTKCISLTFPYSLREL